MNIFHKVALQGLVKSRTRTLVTIIGVALSAALITAVATFAVSLQAYMINGAREKYGSWHVSFPSADASFMRKQAAGSRVADVVSFENIGYAMLEGGKNPDKPYLFFAGFNDKTFDKLPIELISGRLPENSSEILIPSHVFSNGKVDIPEGSRLTLAVGKRHVGKKVLSQHKPFHKKKEKLAAVEEKTYIVVGTYQRPAFEEYAAPGYTVITIGDSEHEKDLNIFVELNNPYGLRDYVGGITGGRGYVLNDNVLRFMGVSGDQMFNTLLYSTGGILAALIMIGSVFLIYNSFHISLNERMHQFGILMSIGATEKQLRNSVLFEGLCISVVGIPLGILIGIPSIKLVLALVAENFANILYNNVPLDLQISVPVLIAAVAFSVITILISAYIPARKAVMTPIMECIRQTNEITVEGSVVRTSKFTEYLCGLEGMLALKNFKRNRRRYRSIILSLTLSVVLFVSAGAFRTDLNQISEQSIVEIDGDIILYAKAEGERELMQLYDKLKNVKGVTKSDYQESLAAAGDAGGSDSGPVMIFWSEKPAQTTEKMERIVEGMGSSSEYTLKNIYKTQEENRNILFIINLFTGVFIAMISLIAVANVFNTISTNIKLRRKELAMLRSVGMSDHDFNSMMRFECMLYGLRTLLFGLPVAGLCSWLIHWGLGEETDFTFPWASLGISVLGVFIVIFITMLYAVSKIKKENIIDALRDDMM